MGSSQPTVYTRPEEGETRNSNTPGRHKRLRKLLPNLSNSKPFPAELMAASQASRL
jgi:hypothetical protein